MAKKSKDTTASTAKKEAKVKGPADPIAIKNLIRLLNILALLLAIIAFILQLFAVITHHWKWQTTNLHSIYTHRDRSVQRNVYDDSRIEQRYGLYTRDVKVYANNDEQLDVLASTRFPRLDNGDEDLHRCLAQTSTLRGALLTCADRIISPEQCHCRRYPHWNAIIFFEITALILLGLVVLIVALLSTQFHALLKLIGVALSFLAFLFLLIGLILLLSYLKRETRTIADTFPHLHSRFAHQIARIYQTSHKIVRRQAHETYRAYPLSAGQRPFNQSHFYQYLENTGQWILRPYSDYNNIPYEPRSQPVATQRVTPAPVPYNPYGPPLAYDQVIEHTYGCIGWSTVLSILAMILALLIPLILVFSWLTAKKLGTEIKTVTTTTVKTEYVPIPQEVHVETVPLTRSIVTEGVRPGPYDIHSGRQEPVVIHDVVIRDDRPLATHTHRT